MRWHARKQQGGHGHKTASAGDGVYKAARKGGGNAYQQRDEAYFHITTP